MAETRTTETPLRKVGPGLYKCPHMPCAHPGVHRVMHVGKGVVCPGCCRACLLPEGVVAGGQIKTVE